MVKNTSKSKNYEREFCEKRVARKLFQFFAGGVDFNEFYISQ